MIIYTDPQGSDAWLEARRGVITGSRFRDCREKLRDGRPSKACLVYAMDVARERLGGKAPAAFVTSAMKMGTAEEQFAKIEYLAQTGRAIEEAGFITTDDRKFGCSVDGLIGDEGIAEVKTMVSSDTLFKAMVDGDISEYVDQCNGEMWLLGRKWVDLILWAPDLAHLGCALTVIRIDRDDNVIEALEADLIKFEQMVSQFELKLRATAARSTADATPPWGDDAPAVIAAPVQRASAPLAAPIF